MSMSETNKKMDPDEIDFRDFQLPKKKKKNLWGMAPVASLSLDQTQWIKTGEFIAAEQNLDCR